MSITPIASPNLPGPSSGFSFFPDEEKNPSVSSNEERTLKDRVCSVVDRLGYKTYSIFNRPLIMPLGLAEAQYEVDKEKFFAYKPRPFEEIKQRVLSYLKVDAMSWEEKMQEENMMLYMESESWAGQLEKENLELYSDPEFRKNRAQEYADSSFRGRVSMVQDAEEFLIYSFCHQELHDLYRKEPKYLRDSIPTRIWVLKGHNKPILIQHKKEWDKLSASEKTEKIFGKPKKYEIAAGIATAASCFFLCHSIYRQLSPAV